MQIIISPIENLPNEVLLIIFSFLKVNKDIFNIRLISKRWRKLADRVICDPNNIIRFLEEVPPSKTKLLIDYYRKSKFLARMQAKTTDEMRPIEIICFALIREFAHESQLNVQSLTNAVIRMPPRILGHRVIEHLSTLDLALKYAEETNEPNKKKIAIWLNEQLDKREDIFINFAGLNLAGIDFWSAHLKNVDLKRTCLANSDLSYSRIPLTNLMHADLNGAKFIRKNHDRTYDLSTAIRLFNQMDLMNVDALINHLDQLHETLHLYPKETYVICLTIAEGINKIIWDNLLYYELEIRQCKEPYRNFIGPSNSLEKICENQKEYCNKILLLIESVLHHPLFKYQGYLKPVSWLNSAISFFPSVEKNVNWFQTNMQVILTSIRNYMKTVLMDVTAESQKLNTYALSDMLYERKRIR